MYKNISCYSHEDWRYYILFGIVSFSEIKKQSIVLMISTFVGVSHCLSNFSVVLKIFFFKFSHGESLWTSKNTAGSSSVALSITTLGCVSWVSIEMVELVEGVAPK